MKEWKFVIIAVASVLVSGMLTEYLFGSKALMGMVAGIILITWIRALYDRIDFPSIKKGENQT